MMAENPNWWSLNGSSSSPQPSITSTDDHQNQDFPLSWGQQLLGGLASEEGRFSNTSSGPNFQHNKKMEKYWADHDQMIKNNNNENYITSNSRVAADFVKQETTTMMMPAVSSPRSSCITTSSSSNIYLDFSSNQLQDRRTNQHILFHHSSHQGNDTSATSGASKKARVQPSSNQKPPLKVKVRKEKLGDRITALHQLVSPFGKTDTASVLLEAIGYIRFLEAQIQALSSPYLGNVSSGQSMRIHQSVTTEPPPKDLRSRGLRLVPVDCTHHINIGISDNINGADYWASSGLGAGGF